MSIFSSWGLQSFVTAKPNPKTERFNPHPPGVIREGSVTHAVLLFLKTNKGKRFSTYQIIHSLGCSEKAASWAFIYLRRTGLVEVCPDDRNPRYMRYRVNEKQCQCVLQSPEFKRLK